VDRFETLDWFDDPDVHQDPYPYLAYLRGKGPVVRLPRPGVVAVTDYDEIQKLYWDNERYSSVLASSGPIPGLPFTPEGEDITEQIAANRDRMLRNKTLVTMDPPAHGAQKSLLMGVITPKRFKDNEAFIRRFADRQIDEILSRGRFEAVADMAHPLSVLVVADLIGVPESEHARILSLVPRSSSIIGAPPAPTNPHLDLAAALTEYLRDRRSHPRNDILSDLAHARYPDGSEPAEADVLYLAAVLFSAGQDTTVKLMGTALQILGDDPDLQQRVRDDLGLVAPFVEETLRFESPSKVSFRLARVRTEIAGVEIAPGTIVMLATAAAHRDPRRFERPDEFMLDRPNAHEHFAFGRGPHACVGAPLTRAVVRIALARLLERTSQIRIDADRHGPPGARRYQYPARYTVRGPLELHVEVTPSEG
jgi:cytochrome P450